MFGYTGRILHVDLTQGTFSIQTFDEAFARKYLGGNGFAAKILYDGLKPGIDPFSPENLVVFAVGPVTDTPFPSTSRAYAATKSPLNGLFFDSTFGGRFAITQKRTGFEAIVISGKAKEPVYLRVDENGAELKSAAAVWEQDHQRNGRSPAGYAKRKTDVVAIGPAGEKLVRYACLTHFWRGREGVGGRGGLGAVLRSKMSRRSW
jgi:aldehyde:ferredoxin oxidoreductase